LVKMNLPTCMIMKIMNIRKKEILPRISEMNVNDEEEIVASQTIRCYVHVLYWMVCKCEQKLFYLMFRCPLKLPCSQGANGRELQGQLWMFSVVLIKSFSPDILTCSVFNFEYLLLLLIKNELLFI
jgi:hypothetical protein